MDVLVLGANGLLGSNVVTACIEREWTVSGTYHSTDPGFDGVDCRPLDVTDHERLRAVVADVDPDCVMNCVAMTDVDGCEADPDRAWAVNADAPAAIAEYCVETGRGFLHVSTDYVFDGETDGLYDESAPTNPLQVYGETKLAGEEAVRAAMPDALITRLSFVYGVHRATGELTGFPAWVRGKLRAGESVPLFTDQYVTPSRAGQTAAVLCDLLDTEAAGTYHVACRSCVTPYEFGSVLCDALGGDESLLEVGRQADVDRPAVRPARTCLDVTTLESRLGRRQPTLAEDVERIGSWLK